MPDKKYKLVIFDFDGTLVDSKDVIAEATNLALADCGYPTMSSEEITALVGLPLDYSLRHFLGETATEEAVEELLERYRARWYELEPGRLHLFPGVRELLDALSKAGIAMSIATSKSGKGLDRVMDTLTLRDYFGFVLTNDLVRNAKPYPEMIERTLKHFGMSPPDALMVGDTTFDIEMGQAAGVDTCAVTYGSHAVETLAELSPTYLVNTAAELLDLLTGRRIPA